MLKIGMLYNEIVDNKIRLNANIEIDGFERTLFFETSVENKQYVCQDKADGFLVGLLIVAMQKGSDIIVESPVSERLIYGITNLLIPALLKMNKGLKKINIYCNFPVNTSSNCYQGVATGISCGVDSFYTVLKNIESEIPRTNKITHLTLFNAGNFGLDYETSTVEFYKQIGIVSNASVELGLPIVWLNSNLMEFVSFPFEQVHTFCNIASAIILQRLIKTYYYSSGHSISEFSLDFSDSSHYDLINEKALQTESLEMISFGGMVSRLEKTEYISDFDSVKHHLNVCLKPTISRIEDSKLNCSYCSKCIRTMTSLDILGKLDNYDQTFDLDLYNNNRAKFWGELRYIKWRTRDEFASEIISNAQKLDYSIPISSYFWMVSRGIINQINKFK
nr:hypothetical protein [uncultured Trichococcus sp.]